jgi:anaerobic magnesium-protoporphyrin IX monomethyl ester cyclase
LPLPIVCIYTVESYITLEKPLDCGNFIPFGISMIASVLKREGHKVKFLVFTPDTPLVKSLRPVIESFQPKLICLTAVSTQFPLVNRVAEAVKQIDPHIFVALGGPYASIMPDEAIVNPFLDAICIGEGDEAIIALAAQIESGLSPTGIHNFWIKKRTAEGIETIEKNSPAPFINDLDSLPFIDRELLRPWIEHPDKEPAILVGRGCPFSCSYCSNHMLRKLAKGRYVRYRSPNNILREIEQITENNPVTNIYLEVETIGSNIEYALQLGNALAEFNKLRKVPIIFQINLAITSKFIKDIALINRLLSVFHQANIKYINVGLESGSERIRSEILRRPPYANVDIIHFCDIARTYDININLFVMIGLPDETIHDFQQTIDVLKRCEPNAIFLSIFYPYPGTDLYKFAKAKGLFDGRTISHVAERQSVHVHLPEFPRRRILLEYILLDFKVYRGRWSLLRRVLHTLKIAIKMNPKFNRWYYHLSRNTNVGRALYRKLKVLPS